MNIESVITAQTNLYRAGMENSPAQRKLDAILAAYERVRSDPSARIPTLLMCALECARA